MSDHVNFLARQTAFSRATFGPGERSKGVLDHIEQEIEEIRECESPRERAQEWVDMVLLSQDGLLRAMRETLREAMASQANEEVLTENGVIIARFGEPTTDYVAQCALVALTTKRDKNELREWGDWRAQSEDEAINHVGGVHD